MTRKEQDDFITRIAPAAQLSQARTGVPASITLAQAILESGWGQSRLSKQGNNFFGIKARRDEDYAEFATIEFEKGVAQKQRARFRRFQSEAQCFEAHAKLLSTLPRYALAMGACDAPEVFAARIQEGGYSTDPKYAVKLMSLVTRYNLTRFDLPRKKKEG
jgi:flagellum-specific peptidoglycan hydrolase FlgJ